jgi:hypothetical protein
MSIHKYACAPYVNTLYTTCLHTHKLSLSLSLSLSHSLDAGVKLVGTYDVTCELEEDSEKCGEPLCDDLVLKGWGRIYIDWKAAIEGKPTIKRDYSCKYTVGRNGDSKSSPKNMPSAPAKTNPAQVASADSYYEKDEPEYWKGRWHELFEPHGYMYVVMFSQVWGLGQQSLVLCC